ncbi:FprA family A-type flavoprotein [Desulfobulbus oligotrophicus]|jgi:flavorubredoxin|uniref:FprA family A-type flavoprotein n=1 Tax=Desulfobulbus oligotrophicus TaxID=1909699 RepID=A0A7T5VFD1_9BACT|nr:FprA family A-type flavoprotein [Desulfobulbus oligotrophicus]MDY0390687.1 FprA family A-type flavoprotein [Desulfobulbus oligotrophicus]QQG66737.1 FprA family A-type flavoprotein [Desulfobulbus oligotrophicus]
MNKRKIKENIYWLGAIDWDRRLFDSLVPLPDGTSYNAYLIEGSEKTALLDAVDPAMTDTLFSQLQDTAKVDFIISHHTEQDHSGTIPLLLERYPNAKVLTTPRGKTLLMDHLHLAEEVLVTVADGETLSLGDKTLRFIHTPWVHWPETMVSYLEEDRILFSCDFFGSHIAASELYVQDQARVYEAAKRYFGEIMLPFRAVISKNLEKLADLPVDIIAPSHGQVYNQPDWIVEAYRDWVLHPPRNLVVLPFISMHGSTRIMVDHLTAALTERGVQVELFNLTVTDIGKLAMALIDAATIVVGSPTVLAGPHPLTAYATFLANALRPKAQFVSIIGSYGWGGKTVETLAGMITNLKAEVLEPVLCKGLPDQSTFAALDQLADTIAQKHRENGFQ